MPTDYGDVMQAEWEHPLVSPSAAAVAFAVEIERRQDAVACLPLTPGLASAAEVDNRLQGVVAAEGSCPCSRTADACLQSAAVVAATVRFVAVIEAVPLRR